MKNKILIVIVAVSAAAVGLQAKNFSVPTNFPTGEYVQFKPAGSHLCLGPERNSNGSNLVLMSCSNSSTKFRLSAVSGKRGNYRIRVYRGGYLGVNKIKRKGARLVRSSNARQVKFLAENSNTFFVKFANRGHVWDVSRGKVRSIGTKVCQYNYHGGKNQQWRVYLVNDRRYFNYRTYGRSSSDSRYNRSSPSESKTSLRASLNKYVIEQYFATCSYSQFRNENIDNVLARTLNRKSLSTRLNLVPKLLDGVKRNRNQSVRTATYKALIDVDLSGGNFLEKAVKSTIKKNARKTLRRENNYSARKYLKQFIQNLR